jgi:hypothetical protein
MDTPKESPAPVVVTPIPARSSRMIWLGDIMAAVGGIVTIIPELATDPAVIAWMNETMSAGARRTVGIVVLVIGYVIRRLRKATGAPIAGTPVAANAMQFISPPQDAAARTKEKP